MGSTKAIVNVPGWADWYAQQGEVGDEAQAYAYVPVLYRCVRLRADALSSVPLRLYTGQGEDREEVEWPWPDMDISRWVWQVSAALDLAGASYSVKLRNGLSGKVRGLQWLNPYTVRPQAIVGAGGQVAIRFDRTGSYLGGAATSWAQEEMLYIREFNPRDDVLPGPSMAQVALGDAKLMRYLTRFASRYFEQGAMPLTVLGLENTTAAEVKRIEGLFRSIGTGVQNAFRAIGWMGKITPTVLTPNPVDLAMPELTAQARQGIAAAFGIPQTMLEDAANYATSKEHRLSFWQDTIRPRGMLVASALTEQVFRRFGMVAEFAFDELDIMQEDEANRAGSLSALTNAGVPLDIAMRILGYDLDSEDWERIIEKANRPAPQPPVFLPAAQPAQPEADGEQEQPEQTGEGETEQPATEDTTDDEDEEDAKAKTARLLDLEKWRRKSLKLIEKGKPAATAFTSEAIPVTLHAAIMGALEVAGTVEQVKAVFRDALAWEG